MTNTVIIRFAFDNAAPFRTRYTKESFDANVDLLSFLAQFGVVTAEVDTGQPNVIDLTARNNVDTN